MYVSTDRRCLHDERYVIMRQITEYILSVTAASVICAVIKLLVPGKDALGKILQLITGIFMTVTVFSFLFDFQLPDMQLFMEKISPSVSAATEEGRLAAIDDMRKIIKEKTQAYILTKSKELEISICVDVTVSDSELPNPISVVLSGSVSPYKKQVLTDYIVNQFGIGEEYIIWN